MRVPFLQLALAGHERPDVKTSHEPDLYQPRDSSASESASEPQSADDLLAELADLPADQRQAELNRRIHQIKTKRTPRPG